MPAKPAIDPQDRDVVVDVPGGPSALQSGSYALEALSGCRGTRASCFGSVLRDDWLHLWYYNPCGIVYTRQALSLIHDFEKFAAIVIAIVGCTPEYFGGFPTTVMKPLSPNPEAFPPSDLTSNTFYVRRVKGKQKLHVTLAASVTTSYGLTGRRSFIYFAEVTPGVDPKKENKSEVIVKFSYQAAHRALEQGIIERARKAGIGHLPVVHAWEDLWRLEDSSRVLAVRRKQRKTHASKEAIEKELEAAKTIHGFPLYEDRILRAIVYPQYQSIKDLFTDCFELIPIMVEQMIDCMFGHRRMYGRVA